MTAHAKLSASGSARWINCPGSVRAEEGFPDSTSIFAEEGTMAHELAQRVLEYGGSAFDYEGIGVPEGNVALVPPEMCAYIQEYVDYVDRIDLACANDNSNLLIEHRVDFSPWVPDGFGTCDTIVLDDGHLHIIDLKYGKGVPVYAQDNTQGILYALGAYNELNQIYGFETVTIHIVQPRLDSVSDWTLSVDELLAWGERISQAAQATQDPDAERIPSEKACQWCKAKAVCPALLAKTEAVLMSEFDDLDPVNPDQLTDEQIVTVLDNKKLIVAWLGAVEEHVTEKLKSGEDFVGYKLVAGRSNRAWGNEDTAAVVLAEVLGEDAFTRKIISVAAAEKKLGKGKAGKLEGLVVKPEGSPTLVSASDPRPAVNVSAASFD